MKSCGINDFLREAKKVDFVRNNLDLVNEAMTSGHDSVAGQLIIYKARVKLKYSEKTNNLDIYRKIVRVAKRNGLDQPTTDDETNSQQD